MNNRKRARIMELKRECKAEIRKFPNSYSAQHIVWWRYQEKIDRVAWGDDLQDRLFREFMAGYSPRRTVGPIFG